MRDSLLMILLVAGIYAGWSFTHRSSTPPFNPVKGVQNEKPNHASSGQTRHHGQSQRTSEPLAEVESLPTIYQDTEEQRLDESTVDSLETKPDYGAIKGVPIQAWVQNRSSLPPRNFTAYPREQRMRVFVQCHEMKKKGFEYVGDNDCKGLITRSLSE